MLTGGWQRKWGRQPYEGFTRLRESHWLADSILFVDSGKQALYKGTPLLPLSATLQHLPNNERGSSPTLFEKSINSRLAAGLFDEYAIPNWTATDPVTCLAWHNGNPSGVTPLVCIGSSTGTSSGSRAVRTGSTNTVTALSTTSTGTSATGATTTAAFTDYTWNQAVGVFVSNTSRAAFLNGGNKDADTVSNVVGTVFDRILVGATRRNGTLSTTAGANGTIALPMVIGRALSDAEVQALYEEQLSDPWSIFQPPRIWVPLQASSGGPFEVDQTSAVAVSGAISVDGNLAYVAPFAVDPANLPIAGAISVAGDLAYTAPFSLDPAALAVTGAVTVAGDLAFSTAIALQLNPSPLAISASITVAGDLAPYPFLELVPSPLPIAAQVLLSADLQYSIGFILSPSALPVTATAAVAGDLQYSTAPPPTPSGGWGAGASGGGGRGLRELTAKIGKDAEDLLERKRKARHEPAPESPQRQSPARVAEASPVARPAGRTGRDAAEQAKPAVPGPREQGLLDLRALERRVQKLEEMILEDRRRREEEAEEEAVVKLLLG